MNTILEISEKSIFLNLSHNFTYLSLKYEKARLPALLNNSQYVNLCYNVSLSTKFQYINVLDALMGWVSQVLSDLDL